MTRIFFYIREHRRKRVIKSLRDENKFYCCKVTVKTEKEIENRFYSYDEFLLRESCRINEKPNQFFIFNVST